MKPQSIIVFTISTLFLGFMLAVQFQTMKKPESRDTRSLWQLREDLEVEKKRQVQLNKEIAHYETLLNQYLDNPEHERINVMEQALEQLEKHAGLTKLTGEGLTLTIEPLFQDFLIGEEVPSVTPHLLMRLINQLNMFGIQHMQIANERMISLSAIREVNGVTYVNNRPLPDYPIQINIIAEDVVKLYDQFKAANIIDEFAKDNLAISAELKNKLILTPYDRNINVNFLEQLKEEL